MALLDMLKMLKISSALTLLLLIFSMISPTEAAAIPKLDKRADIVKGAQGKIGSNTVTAETTETKIKEKVKELKNNKGDGRGSTKATIALEKLKEIEERVKADKEQKLELLREKVKQLEEKVKQVREGQTEGVTEGENQSETESTIPEGETEITTPEGQTQEVDTTGSTSNST
jgi:glutamyl/glutaminyl-tRNA synthetase